MGDLAESCFETVWPARWERFGLNRSELSMSMLPPFIRHAPDYLTSACLVEVAGFGTDQVFKFKDIKAQVLFDWNEVHDVRVFIFDSKNSRYGHCTIEELASTFRKKQVKSEQFHDGPTYKAIPAAVLPVEWTELGA
jgi:hypothetical protein